MQAPTDIQRANAQLSVGDGSSKPAIVTHHSGTDVIFNITMQPSSTIQHLTIKHEGLPMPGGSNSTQKASEEAVKELEYKHLPEWLRKFCKTLEKMFGWTLWGIGVTIATIGFGVLIAGTVYCLYTIGNTLKTNTDGLTGLVQAIVKTVSIPGILLGGAMLHYGRGLMKADTGQGGFLSFVAPIYNWYWPYTKDVIISNDPTLPIPMGSK